jgi:hypothetical protein
MKPKHLIAVTLYAAGLFLCADNLCAQEQGSIGPPSVTSQKTGVPADARFEIIQTNSNIRTTLKLDKYTGDVYELVRNKDLVRAKDEDYAWAKIRRLSHPLDKTESPGEVNYQIITTSVGLRYTFLINTRTGASWKLSADPDREQSYWYPIKSQ